VTADPHCVKIRLREGDTYKRLHPAVEFFVLELTGPANETIYARIDDGPSPWVVEIAHFEVVDDRMPSNWRVRFGTTHTKNWVHIAPEPWLRPGFWEDFFGGRFDEHPGTLGAQAEYARERGVMLDELG
jgi:hypothetical protein